MAGWQCFTRTMTLPILHQKYLADADKMRLAAHNKVGRYGYVQDLWGAPFFNAPGRATEGQAGFLLMEAAYNNYVY